MNIQGVKKVKKINCSVVGCKKDSKNLITNFGPLGNGATYLLCDEHKDYFYAHRDEFIRDYD